MNKMKPLTAIAIAFVALASLVLVLWQVHNELDNPGFWLSVLVCGAGIAVGWMVGFIASPRKGSEEERFAAYGRLIGAAISGYLLSRLEPTLTQVFATGNIISVPIYGVRFMAFLIGLVVGAISMYVYRSYLEW